MMDLIALREVPNHLPRTRGRPVHLATIYRWVYAGKLPAVKIGGRFYCERKDVCGLARAFRAGTGVQPTRKRRERADQEWAASVLDAAGV